MLSAVVVAPWNEAASAAADAVQQGLQLRLRRWRITSSAAASSSWLGGHSTVVIVLDRDQAVGDAAGVAALRTALRDGLAIVPVLIDGAGMPAVAMLPADLQHFPYLNAVLGNRDQFTALLDRVAEAVQTPATLDEPWTPTQFVANALEAAYPVAIRWSCLAAGGLLAVYTVSRGPLAAGRWSAVYAMAAIGIALPLSALWIGCRRLGWWGIPAAIGYLFLLILGLSFLALVLEGILGLMLDAIGLTKSSPGRVAGTNAVLTALALGTLLAGRAVRQFRMTPALAIRRLAAKTALLGGLVCGLLVVVDFSLRVAANAQGVDFSDINAPPEFFGETLTIMGLLQVSLLAGTALGMADAVFKVWRGGGPRIT
jgi:hypothetical protein